MKIGIFPPTIFLLVILSCPSYSQAWFILCLPYAPQIQGFNLTSRPWGPSQKLQAGLDTRVIIKTPDADDFSQFLPAMKFHQPGKNHFQSDAMKRIVGLPLSHVYTLYMPSFFASLIPELSIRMSRLL